MVQAVQIAEGSKVYTADGELLGRVKARQGRFFKIGAPFHFDYWLAVETVADVDYQHVGVTFVRRSLDEHRLPYHPDHCRDGATPAEHGDETLPPLYRA